VAISVNLQKACQVLLEDRIGSNDPDYNFNGNVMLDQLYYTNVSVRDRDFDMNKEMADLAEKLREDGKKP